MNIKFLAAPLISALLLTACGNDFGSERMTAPAPMADMGMELESKMQASVKQSGDGYSASTDKAEMLLTYRYNYQFEIPAQNLEGVSKKALQSCADAGADMCRIVSSSLNRYSEDMVNANIELRVQPAWFETYKDSLAAESKAANGKLTSSNVSAEDLTIAISDSDARLNSLKTLRARLNAMLETKGSALKDLIEVERELARVQSQIESSTARLRILRTRVSMSQVHLSYESKQVAASRSSLSPIKQALTEFIGTLAYGFANLIRFIAIILPWLIAGLPLLWLFGRWRRKRKFKRITTKDA